MEITLLKEEDVWGDSALEVIQAYGTRTGISDAAIVLGTFVGYGSRNSAGVTSGCVWTASFLEGGSLCVVGAFGKEFNFFPRTREAAVRPALSVSATSKRHHMSAGSVKMNLYRNRKKLLKLLEKEGGRI